MYDTIVVLFPCFLSDLEKEAFFGRFLMSNVDGFTGSRNNAGYQKLEQCRGVYLSYNNSNNTIKMQVSLHKYYNNIQGKGQINYNDFSRLQSKMAYSSLCDFLGLDGGKVLYYEYGINIQMNADVSEYLRELSHIEYGKRNVRILESFKHREYKMYSTNSDSSKRSAYIFYDKSEESKPFCPLLTMRIEKKCLRQNEETQFSGLFEDLFLCQVLSDFEKSFLSRLKYKEYQIQTGTCKDVQVKNMILQYGKEGIFAEIDRMRVNAELNRLQYFRLKEKVKFILEKGEQIKVKISAKSMEMREKIAEKIKKM